MRDGEDIVDNMTDEQATEAVNTFVNQPSRTLVYSAWPATGGGDRYSVHVNLRNMRAKIMCSNPQDTTFASFVIELTSVHTSILRDPWDNVEGRLLRFGKPFLSRCLNNFSLPSRFTVARVGSDQNNNNRNAWVIRMVNVGDPTQFLELYGVAVAPARQ